MDKRWIAILVIIIIACGCGYLILQSSTTVGHAISNVGKSSVTLPHDYSVNTSSESTLKLINKNTNETIYIEDLGVGDSVESDFNNELQNLSQLKNNQIIDKFNNITQDKIKIYAAHYVDSDNEKLKNQSIAFYYTYGHTYYLKLSGFDNIDNSNEKISFIVKTTHPDYKNSQDPVDEPESDLAVKYNRNIISQD